MLRGTVEDLKLTCQHHLEDKRDLKANLSEAQKKVSEVSEKLSEKERCISEEKAFFNKQVRGFGSILLKYFLLLFCFLL